VVAVAVAVLVLTATAVWWTARTAGRDTPAVASATLRGLTATTRSAAWSAMDDHHMDGGNGYQMPAQMMPGAPEGDDMRLGVGITLRNSGTSVQLFDLLAEFRLEGTSGGPARLHSDTFGTLPRLGPGSAVDGFLYFDAPVPAADDPPLYLIWQRDGRQRRLAVPLPGGATGHDHGA
jgi:hypothetical protein